MGVFETRTFAIGEDCAVHLPDGSGFAKGMMVRIERVGNALYVHPLSIEESDTPADPDGQPHPAAQ